MNTSFGNPRSKDSRSRDPLGLKPVDGGDDYLTGQLLIAMPSMSDPRFAKSVVYICAHGEEGAMGLVINRNLGKMMFPDLLEQLDIPLGPVGQDINIHFGGPVESGRGFVLHSSDYLQESTLAIDEQVSLTATIDVLKAITQGRGPEKCLLTLGYAGWSPGQLDEEIIENGWLTVEPDDDLIFDLDIGIKWDNAINKLGFDISMLSTEAGHS
ncbi:MAG: YqgE/AlgH family protein [Alphaproteobacteria bacterium]|nr:YqgE/AlgH family protein [Rhodospirillales bacterium]MCW9045741.1 YqgE/AlgH family protein [Alphaproteobacteria bacterium]